MSLKGLQLSFYCPSPLRRSSFTSAPPSRPSSSARRSAGSLLRSLLSFFLLVPLTLWHGILSGSASPYSPPPSAASLPSGPSSHTTERSVSTLLRGRARDCTPQSLSSTRETASPLRLSSTHRQSATLLSERHPTASRRRSGASPASVCLKRGRFLRSSFHGAPLRRTVILHPRPERSGGGIESKETKTGASFYHSVYGCLLDPFLPSFLFLRLPQVNSGKTHTAPPGSQQGAPSTVVKSARKTRRGFTRPCLSRCARLLTERERERGEGTVGCVSRRVFFQFAPALLFCWTSSYVVVSHVSSGLRACAGTRVLL